MKKNNSKKNQKVKSKSYLGESWNYIKKSKNYIFFILASFIFSGLIGFIFSSEFDYILKPLLKDLMLQAEGLSTFQLILFILENNARTAFFMILLGIFFGVVPFLNSLANGVILGYVLKNVWNLSGISEFWRILPHGVFELPAIFLAMGIGTKLGFDFVKGFVKNYWKKSKMFVVIGILFPAIIFLSLLFDKKAGKREAEAFAVRIKNSIVGYLGIILPLLILAAVIEGILIGIYK